MVAAPRRRGHRPHALGCGAGIERHARAVRAAQSSFLVDQAARTSSRSPGDGGEVWPVSASSLETARASTCSGSVSSKRVCNACGSSSSQPRGLELPVPRWSMNRMSRASFSLANSGITCAARDTAPWPGPPASTTIGSGWRALARAGTTARLREILRPFLLSRSSHTSWVAHWAAVSTPARRQLSRVIAGRGASLPEEQAAIMNASAVAETSLRRFIWDRGSAPQYSCSELPSYA